MLNSNLKFKIKLKNIKRNKNKIESIIYNSNKIQPILKNIYTILYIILY